MKTVAAFQRMHVLPAKHSYAWLPRKCEYHKKQTHWQTDRQMPGMHTRQLIDGQIDKMITVGPNLSLLSWQTCVILVPKQSYEHIGISTGTKHVSGNDLHMIRCHGNYYNKPVLSWSPNSCMNTLASVPAPNTSPVTTFTWYVVMVTIITNLCCPGPQTVVWTHWHQYRHQTRPR